MHHLRLIAACAAFPATLCLAFEWPQKTIDFELTGTVRDADTKEALEGAYVIATYKIMRSGLAATATPCVKTRGMYTGKDGTYHFPVERLDGLNPFSTNAIKPGHFWKESPLPPSAVWKKQGAEAYSRRDIYLKKQDPANPDWHLSDGDEVCNEAPTREAAAAGVIFMKLKHAEHVRYNAREQSLRLEEAQIKKYENLPAEGSGRR